MRITISPRSGAPYRSVILWLEDMFEDRDGVGLEELFGHEADLIVHWVS